MEESCSVTVFIPSGRQEGDDLEIPEGYIFYPQSCFIPYCLSLIPSLRTVPNIKIDSEDSRFSAQKDVFKAYQGAISGTILKMLKMRPIKILYR